MTPREHVEKARRIMSSLGHLRTPFPEMEIEARMLAGTHLVNAVFHTLDVRSQDIVHSWGNVLANLDEEARTALNALEAIESPRPLYVRGAEPDPDQAVRMVVDAYQQLADLTTALIADS